MSYSRRHRGYRTTSARTPAGAGTGIDPGATPWQHGFAGACLRRAAIRVAGRERDVRTAPDYERISGQTGDNLYAQQWTTLQYRRGQGRKGTTRSVISVAGDSLLNSG